MVNDLIIVGAGGFGRELRAWLWEGVDPTRFSLKGFLSREKYQDLTPSPTPWLGDPLAYLPQPRDRFLLAIGDIEARRQVVTHLRNFEGQFATFIHRTAVISSSARIGIGAVIYPYAIVSSSALVHDFCHLSLYASVSHDASLGENSYLSPYATLNGGACVENDVFMGTHAVVGPKVCVGARAKIAAGSVALHDVPAGALAVGTPAKSIIVR